RGGDGPGPTRRPGMDRRHRRCRGSVVPAAPDGLIDPRGALRRQGRALPRHGGRGAYGGGTLRGRLRRSGHGFESGLARHRPGGALAPPRGRRQGFHGAAQRRSARRLLGGWPRGGRRSSAGVVTRSRARIRDGHRAIGHRLPGHPRRRGPGDPGTGGAAMRRASPIQRVPAMWGLAGLVPIAVLLFKEDLTLFDAGMRALAVLAAVMFLRWLGDKAVRGVLATLEPEPVPAEASQTEESDACGQTASADWMSDGWRAAADRPRWGSGRRAAARSLPAGAVACRAAPG